MLSSFVYSQALNFRFSGAGLLRVPNIPPEFKAFKGQVVHTANWDPSIDYKGKRVALVGSGSR
jgi:cation diffusion facilitator CzcD-associated flavoprotein CzcO